jgi:O-antigen ligase
LAKFAHDSYYVRIAVEGGWFGLIIYMIFMFVCVRRTLYFYLRVRDPEIKAILLSLLVAIFLLAVANYPQEAIVQVPTSMAFHVMLAIVVRIKDFDEHYKEMERLLKAKREI